MAKFQGHGDVCARVGLNFLSCLSSPDCANLYRNALCAPSEEALSSCASDGSSDVGPSVGGAPATTDPGTGSRGGAGTVGAPVYCDLSSGGGIAGSSNIGGSTVACEQTYESCDDGHTYYSVCVIGDHAESVCSCFLDGALQTSFTPSVACPAAPEINQRCNWSLVL
ncbi:MAG TPA: hypothetical protein VER12_16280 [Polyangiaceae bacterium]|nr:hypothetical protein [Polyangiaceae bacterium]